MHPNIPPYFGHARLTIYLDRIAHNWRTLAGASAPATCAAVVKADGYGVGASPVAEALYLAGCRFFYVATPLEGALLRPLLPEAEIAVLHGPLGEDISLYASQRLIPVINHSGQWQDWLAFCRKQGEAMSCILHVDTGMNRLGFNTPDFLSLWQEGYFADCPIRLVMSHLACPDTPEHPLNALQLARAQHIHTAIAPLPFSFASSSGIYLGGAYHFQQTRSGGSLYGNNPTPGQPNPLRNAVDLHAPLLQIRQVAEEGSIGYGATTAVNPDHLLGVVPVGYADGYPRIMQHGQVTAHLKDGSHLNLPIIGRISMDSICIDLTPIGEPAAELVTSIELLGDHQTLDDVAKRAHTIGYELLTRLGNRFQRCYIGMDQLRRHYATASTPPLAQQQGTHAA